MPEKNVSHGQRKAQYWCRKDVLQTSNRTIPSMPRSKSFFYEYKRKLYFFYVYKRFFYASRGRVVASTLILFYANSGTYTLLSPAQKEHEMFSFYTVSLVWARGERHPSVLITEHEAPAGAAVEIQRGHTSSV
jgi:hypothetical protein